MVDAYVYEFSEYVASPKPRHRPIAIRNGPVVVARRSFSFPV